jgi:predicted nucleotidyltransferase
MNHQKIGNFTQNWVKLLLPFTNDYRGKLTGSQLARLTGTPQQTASRLLQQLEARRLLGYEHNGRNKLYFIPENVTTLPLLTLLEAAKALSFQERKPVAVLLSELLAHCESIIVFGSYAKNEERQDSDLDLIIVQPENQKAIKDIKRISTVQINEEYVTYSQLRATRSRPLWTEIQESHVFLGDTEKLIRIFR